MTAEVTPPASSFEAYLPSFNHVLVFFAVGLVVAAAYHYGRERGFARNVTDGLTSNTFDLNLHNVGDSRDGLDEVAGQAIRAIMKRERVGFDEARLAYVHQQMRDNGIGEDGVPLDPRAVRL